MRLIDADALWMEVIHTLDYCDDILEIIEHQKTIWSTHHNDSNTLETLDCIGRQEAVEAMFALADGCERDDPCRENPHIDAIVDTLENLPSAQSELICCKDCKFTDGEKPIADGRYWCVLHSCFMDFCSYAERRS